MASRSEAYETLTWLLVRDGVPPTCICFNAKELIQGKFYQKLKVAACHLKQLELYTPWSNAAEVRLKRLRKGLVVSCCSLEHQSAYVRDGSLY